MRWSYIGMINLAAAVALAFSASAERYRNREYGFSVEIAGRSSCVGAPEEHHHGIDLYLDAGPSNCDALMDRPFVGINGDYNAGFEPSAKAEAEYLCDARKARRVAPPKRLRIDGLVSAACRTDSDDGWIEILVVAQTGKWREKPVDPGDETALINYDVLLRTKAERFDDDLKQLRSVLKSIRLFKRE